MTIRSMIDEKIAKLRNANLLSPQELAQESIELSSLWASVNSELVQRRMDYNDILRCALESYGTPPKAKIYAEATPEYKHWLEAEAYSKSLLELIRTTKRAVALAEQEYREARHE